MKTNVKETSIDAYRSPEMLSIKANYQERIAGYMLAVGKPLTRREIGSRLNLQANQYSARCNELVAAKILVVTGKRKCSISGKTVEVLMHHKFADPQNELF